MSEKQNWVAIIECKVKKSVCLSQCTLEQAKNNPWEYATDEDEVDMIDWKVLKVEPNV